MLVCSPPSSYVTKVGRLEPGTMAHKAMAEKTIYLAGPDVFLPDAVAIGRRKQQLCRDYGFEGLFPLDKDKETEADATKIFRANCDLMRRANIGMFNLTPFRGPSADVGTAFEVAFMFAAGKPLFGYASVTVDYYDRVAATFGPITRRDGQPFDRNDCAVENFNLYDNLMIARAIEDSGGVLVRVDENDSRGPSLAALKAFQAGLEVARSQLG
jgi:nucleoside 2-deoxyribosyltransferase